MHEDEKYEKFAYSTHFAFSVSKEASTLAKGAFDSMLAVKRTGKDLWHVRSGCDTFSLKEDRVSFTWSPMEDVQIETVITPVGMWHVRCHRIRTSLPIEAAEGAFAVKKDGPGERPCDRIRTRLAAGADRALAFGAYGASGVFAVCGYDQGEVVHTEPNTNLMHPRTVLPMLRARLAPGSDY